VIAEKMDNNQMRSAEDHQQSAFLERNPKETEEKQIDLERDRYYPVRSK